jgi:hypothetical protein
MLDGVVVGTVEIVASGESYSTNLSDLNETSQSNVHSGVKVDSNYVGGGISIAGTSYEKGLMMHAESSGLSEASYAVR